MGTDFRAQQQSGELPRNRCLSNRPCPGEEVGVTGCGYLGSEEFDYLSMTDDAVEPR
jgi:hypothetical protein